MKNNDILFCTDAMKENHRKAMEIDYEIHRDLRVEIVPNGIIHPLEIPEGGREEYNNYGGVTDENLNFIELSLMKRDKGFSVDIDDTDKMFVGANLNRDFSNIDYVDETVVYIGPMHCNISHFYLESFSRWWYFLDNKNLKYKIAYMTMVTVNYLVEIHKEFLELLGIKQEKLIKIDRPIKFKNVIIPEQAMSLNLFYHQKYKELFDKISRDIEPINHKKIYFSKSCNINIERHIGTLLMDKIYSKNGYKVLYPELLSIRDMIAVLKNCEEFVAQSGSNAHNAIFLSDNTKITILNRSAHFHPCQTMINKIRNLKVTYVDCFCEELPVDWCYGPFIFLYTNKLKQYLDANKFTYNAKKLKKENISNLTKYCGVWEYQYTKLTPFAIDNNCINKKTFIKFISFINKYFNETYKNINSSKKIDIMKKSYLFGLIQKQIYNHRPIKVSWKIFGKEFLRYKAPKSFI